MANCGYRIKLSSVYNTKHSQIQDIHQLELDNVQNCQKKQKKNSRNNLKDFFMKSKEIYNYSKQAKNECVYIAQMQKN